MSASGAPTPTDQARAYFVQELMLAALSPRLAIDCGPLGSGSESKAEGSAGR